jgi:predicted dehydrogenase
MTKTETTRAGVIGVGHMGEGHARHYNALSNVDLVGVADQDADRGTAVAAEHGTTRCSIDELLERADAVSIAVPTRYHVDVALQCIDAGVDVLVEKPFVEDLTAGERLVDRAADAGVVLQVGHIERFNPAVTTLSGIVSDLDVIALSSRRVGPAVDRQLTDSVALDLMVHDIDIVLSLLDSSVEEVTAVGRPDGEHATAALRFADGTMADMTASRVTQRTERSLEVVTDSGLVCADYVNQSVAVHRTSETLDRRHTGDRPYTCRDVVEQATVDRGDPLRRELASFIDTSVKGTEPVVDGRDGLRVVEIAKRIEQSAIAPTQLAEAES